MNERERNLCLAEDKLKEIRSKIESMDGQHSLDLIDFSDEVPSAEELQRRLSEEREISEKIKELQALLSKEEILKLDAVGGDQVVLQPSLSSSSTPRRHRSHHNVKSDERAGSLKGSLVNGRSDSSGKDHVTPEVVTLSPSPSKSKMVETGSNAATTAAAAPCATSSSSFGAGAKNRSREKKRAKKGHETSWVYLNAFEDFSNVRTRDRLMRGYNSSSSDEEPLPAVVPPVVAASSVSSRPGNHMAIPSRHYHPNLHALHQIRREKKKGLASDKNVVISYTPRVRVSLLNRKNFYYRVSDKELEALRSFSFLDDISISSPDEKESLSFTTEYFSFMDYELEQDDDEQKQVIPLSEPEIVQERVYDEQPIIDEESSLNGSRTDDEKLEKGTTLIDEMISEMTEVILEVSESSGRVSQSSHTKSSSWNEDPIPIEHSIDIIKNTNDLKFLDKKVGFDVFQSSCQVDDDGYRDKNGHAPSPSPSSTVLDRLSLSDSCAESYFGSDSGGSSLLGGKC